jgi:hypothetical protein
MKEAELILENMMCGNLDAIDTSHKIRRFTIEFLRYKFGEIEESDEMTSDVDGEVNQPTRYALDLQVIMLLLTQMHGFDF